MNEGYMIVPDEPPQIPYRALQTLYSKCSNLVVTLCVSATKVAYGSLKIELQYLIIYRAAGVAAIGAAKGEIPGQRIDVEALQRRFRSQGQIFSTDHLSLVVKLKKFRNMGSADARSHWYWKTSLQTTSGASILRLSYQGVTSTTRRIYDECRWEY